MEQRKDGLVTLSLSSDEIEEELANMEDLEEILLTKLLRNPDLEAEHSALHTMACIIAQKWMLDLEHKDCSFSYDGLKWFYEDEMGEDMRQFKVLIDGHKKRIEEYRDKKREERLAEREKA